MGVDKIIFESKVAKMTFYKYFPSKENLIHESLRLRDSLLRESINNHLNLNQVNDINKLKLFLTGMKTGSIAKIFLVVCLLK